MVTWEFHVQGSLAGYSPWSHKESDTAEWLTLTLLKTGYMSSKGSRGDICIHTYVCMYCVIVQQKITHCNAIILQFFLKKSLGQDTNPEPKPEWGVGHKIVLSPPLPTYPPLSSSQQTPVGWSWNCTVNALQRHATLTDPLPIVISAWSFRQVSPPIHTHRQTHTHRHTDTHTHTHTTAALANDANSLKQLTGLGSTELAFPFRMIPSLCEPLLVFMELETTHNYLHHSPRL